MLRASGLFSGSARSSIAMRLFLVALLMSAAAAILLVLPAPAGANSVIYVDGGNVWTARVDGSHPLQLTSDGTKDTPPFSDPSQNGKFVGPYSNATADDQGRYLAARQFREQNGESQAAFWIWSDATGKQLATPAIVKMSYCGFPSTGPIGARLHPSGTWFAFWYICNYGSPSWDMDLRTEVNTPGSIVQGPEWSGYYQPSWYGKRLTASNQADGGIQADDPSAPLVTNLSFNLWVSHVDPDRITRIEPARTPGRAIIEHYDNSASTVEDRLTFATFSGAPQPGNIAYGCTIPTDGNASSPSWSADGAWVAWSDKGGVKTAAVPANLTSPGPCQMTPRVISATGNQSSLTPYDWGSTGANGGLVPVISRLSQSAKAWRMDNKLPQMSATSRRVPTGTTFSFTVNVSARVTFSFAQQATGRTVHGRCVAPSKKNATKPRCGRTVSAGSFTVAAHKGANKVRFAGRLSRTRKLTPGTYTLTLTANDAAGRRSAPRAVTFTIVK